MKPGTWMKPGSDTQGSGTLTFVLISNSPPCIYMLLVQHKFSFRGLVVLSDDQKKLSVSHYVCPCLLLHRV
jgi:hypothetical protein